MSSLQNHVKMQMTYTMP